MIRFFCKIPIQNLLEHPVLQQLLSLYENQNMSPKTIQIELLYFPISYTERCGTCTTTLETAILKIETEKN